MNTNTQTQTPETSAANAALASLPPVINTPDSALVAIDQELAALRAQEAKQLQDNATLRDQIALKEKLATEARETAILNKVNSLPSFLGVADLAGVIVLVQEIGHVRLKGMNRLRAAQAGAPKGGKFRGGLTMTGKPDRRFGTKGPRKNAGTKTSAETTRGRRVTDAEYAQILKEWSGGQGISVADLNRKHGFTRATIYAIIKNPTKRLARAKGSVAHAA